ncbi:outer membrane protein-like [Moorella thermoacetica]|uniref:TolC family protein n=1 Tax=Neomoorella thermoacetica TaxID=1525 RepID=UPI0006A26840|nr:TolC family protein [Moorella thermoacetica]AKX95195.1 outer membrane efflux protein [Moorella thermoacetica]AKX97820.1 outer membrane efflux protein [Moorella thermoacetica]OIQ56651.1 outer membrane efflux protein [Moorella thermoacetica]OIQ62542.1 outer membrane efflux protein [Moorella thermoacetica]QDA01639.1 Outer membrane efflux protein [Moorella thermoacetica]
MQLRKLNLLLLALFLSYSMIFPAAATAADGKVQKITLQEAVEMALQHDQGVKKAEVEVRSTEALRDNVADNVKSIPPQGWAAPDPVTATKVQATWVNLLSSDLAWRMSKKNLEATRDTLVLKVCKSYWDVQVAQEKLSLQEKLMQQAIKKLQEARAGQRAGTLSPAEIVMAEAQWEQAKKNYEAARQNLNDAYNTFNNLVGLLPEERPLLVDTPDYQPLNINSLDAEVDRVLTESPAVWAAKQQIDIKKWASDIIYDSQGNVIPYKSRQAEVEAAEYDYASAKTAMEKATRALYYQTKSLEESYGTALEALRMAEEALRVEKAKYAAGMSIQTKVFEAEVNVAQAQEAVDELIRNHAYLKLAFEKPWAMQTASGN